MSQQYQTLRYLSGLAGLKDDRLSVLSGAGDVSSGLDNRLQATSPRVPVSKAVERDTCRQYAARVTSVT